MSLLLEIEGLAVERGGSRVLEIPSFSVNRGETVALIGPNGAGKSSLLLSIAGLLPPSSGTLRFNGMEVDLRGDLTPYRRRLAMVFQEPLLFDRTVVENVASGLRLRGMPQGEIGRRVDECMERFRISHLADRSARKLSGGEAQRTNLARAFATGPELLLLDEPFSSLDPLARTELLADLAGTLKSESLSAVISTHDREELTVLADYVCVMDGGRISQTGDLDSLAKCQGNRFAAAFFGVH